MRVVHVPLLTKLQNTLFLKRLKLKLPMILLTLYEKILKFVLFTSLIASADPRLSFHLYEIIARRKFTI